MREFTDGSAAIVRGALSAGCTFFAGYPIIPASPILTGMLRELPLQGGCAVQAEDEVASIGMCLGAVMGGARALTATSGPGMSLHSENLGLAVMGEIPLVVVDVQRLGPATGGATVGQGDVQFARWGTSGGHPLIVLAPSSIPECYSLTRKAFDLAERFRCPVILLADKELALTMNTVAVQDFVDVPVRERPTNGGVSGGPGKPYSFHPPDAVPPLLPYGGPQVVRFTGWSHDENGVPAEDPATVGALNRHLAAKIDDHVDEITVVQADLQEGAQTLLLSYGVTAGAMREAVRAARVTGCRVSALTVNSLWPVPEAAIVKAMHDCERVVVAELNLGQYRREVERVAAGRVQVVGVSRVDGELIAPEQIAREILVRQSR